MTPAVIALSCAQGWSCHTMDRESALHDDEQVGDIIGDPHELDDWVPQLAAAPRAASPPLYLESRADTANSSEADAAGAEPQEMGKFGRARPRKKT